MGSGSKPKPIRPTAEELALQRAQIVALSTQDNELRARQKRIIRGMTGNRASILRSGLSAPTGPSGPAGPTTGGSGPRGMSSGRR